MYVALYKHVSVFHKIFQRLVQKFSTNRKMNSRLSVVVLLCVYVTVCIAAGSNDTAVIRECNQLTIAACQGRSHLVPAPPYYKLRYIYSKRPCFLSNSVEICVELNLNASNNQIQ